MDVGRVIAVLSLAHHVCDHSQSVKIICAIKRQCIAFRNPLLRLHLFSDRSEFFWNELVIHRWILSKPRSSLHRSLLACNKNDGYEGGAVPTFGSRIFRQMLLCANV